MARRKSGALVIAGAIVALGTAANTGAGPAVAQSAAPAMPTQVEAVTFGMNSAVEGERLYGRECAFCHVGRNTGTIMLQKRLPQGTPAQLHERTNLPAAYVRLVVRNGLVNMPPLSRAELSDAELDLIAQWLADGGSR